MSGYAALGQQAAPGPRGAWLSRGQFTLPAVQLGLLAALLLVRLAVDYQRTSLLFHVPLGQKMLTGAASLLGVGLVLHLLGCVAINQLAPAADEALLPRRRLLTLLLAVVNLVLFCFPAVFVLLVGPAAVEIVQTMTAP